MLYDHPATTDVYTLSLHDALPILAMVVRTIASEIPNFEKLELPPVLKDVIMNKRGLVLVVGGTGSGKSTTLAAMIDYRNSRDRKSTRLNSSHANISYAVFCLKKKK